MIQSLKIQNFVLIEELELFFREGMQVLTGETGAGKSIVVDAVNLVLGSRADRGLIRTGCEKASVEAVFETHEHHEIADILEREHIEYDGRTVSLYRELTQTGRNLCRVCGVIVPLALLKELSPLLMDIHGQHEHQFLMDPDMHLHFLDRMGNAEFQKLLKRTEAACVDFINIHRKYARLRREREQNEHRRDELEKNLRELHQARLQEDEEEGLQKECLRLRNAEKIGFVLRSAQEALSFGENGSTLDHIKAAMDSLSTLEKYDEHAAGLAKRCENAYYELEEVSFEISGMIVQTDADPQRLEKAEERLDLIRRFERKYGSTLKDVLSEAAKQEQEYKKLCSVEDELGELARAHKNALSFYRQTARSLSERRKELAKEFENKMMAQLNDLGMEKTEFSVFFMPEGEKKPMPQPFGDDRIEFMISPNAGEPLRPLAKIASGGELSRLMLAMKALESEGSGVDCMVFDEIDTGISGRMAQVVAEKMIAISRHKQVICVTHLPQIAAGADHQFLVAKRTSMNRTSTFIHELQRDERIREIARMISGAEGSIQQAQAYAKSMLEAADRMKQQ